MRLVLIGALLAAVNLSAAAKVSVDAPRDLSPIVLTVIPSGRPDEATVRGIVRTIKSAGFDQFMVYPSTGVGYDYLGDEFFKMMGWFIDEADHIGMKLWIYDEFNWPSGTCRGRVPAENEKCLYRELVAIRRGDGPLSWRLVVSRDENVDNYCLDTNNLEPESVCRFMELTHHEYERHFSRYFGNVVRGFFSDEPGWCSSSARMKMPPGAVARIPWWSGMEDEYSAANGGRDFRKDFETAFLANRLTEAEVLRSWTDLRSKRYVRTFFDPIREWCAARGMVSTGHLVAEEHPHACAYINGSPMATLSAFGKPGIDLIKCAVTDRDFEWITLALAQSAAWRRGVSGSAELFGLGPCDLDFTAMRKLYWIAALHGIDTYFQGLWHRLATRFDIKDSWAWFTSPAQPWFKEAPLLNDAALEASKWASKRADCEIALVYPQRLAGACRVANLGAPDIRGVCRDLTWNGFNYVIVEEDEKTAMPVVLDWDGFALFERRTGTRFADGAAMLDWIERRFANRVCVRDAKGRPVPGYVVRSYKDGSAVAVDAMSGEVIVAKGGKLNPRCVQCKSSREVADRWRLELSGPSKRRVWFWTRVADVQREIDNWLKRDDKVDVASRYERDNMAKLTVDVPIEGVKFAIRRYPENKKFAVTLDGHPLVFDRPCKSAPYGFNELYSETASMDIAEGEHVFELSGGKDGKLFLPVLWMIGDFAETEERRLGSVPADVVCGSLVQQGLSSFAGTATYGAEVTFAPGERLLLDVGGAVARVRLGGRDLGVKGWSPYEWSIPEDLAGKRLRLEVDVTTSVRPVFGSEKSPDAKLDHALWTQSSMADPSPVGLRSCRAVLNAR